MNDRAPYPTRTSTSQPPCPECHVALRPTGGGRHLYWSCGYCGITMPRF